jgi:hypothetical protein
LVLRNPPRARRSLILAVSLAALVCLYLMGCSDVGRGQAAAIKNATGAEIKAFFQGTGKSVLTFLGYSAAGYEDQAAMLRTAERVLDGYDPRKTIVNIGATPEGIGAIYELAKRKGFVTTGIVSSQVKRYEVTLSPYVDYVFYVEDDTWGGYLKRTERLSPTSEAIVENSSMIVAIGGGEVSRDELLSAKRSGKKVQFFAADMNHQRAIEEARRKGLPVPTEFRGAAHAGF